MGIEVSKKATINVSADQLWSMLADEFENVGEWARGVDRSGPNADAAIPEGASVGGRTCDVPGFGAVNETFTSFDAGERSYSFAATASKIPSFVRNLTNHTSVKPLGPDKSELQLRITADAEGIRGAMVKPIMSRKFGKAIGEFVEDLTIFAESGEISSYKAKALAKADR